MCSGDPLNDMATKMDASNPFFLFFTNWKIPYNTDSNVGGLCNAGRVHLAWVRLAQ